MTNPKQQILDVVLARAQAGDSLNDALSHVYDNDTIDVGDLFEDRAFRKEIEDAHHEAYTAAKKARMLVRYTTAPIDYDGFGTFGAPVAAQANVLWREIYVQPENLEWQLQRNGSGLHTTIDKGEFEKRVAAGLIQRNA